MDRKASKELLHIRSWLERCEDIDERGNTRQIYLGKLESRGAVENRG